MKNNLIFYGENFSGKSKLINDIFVDLGSLLRVHGYNQTTKFSNNKEFEETYYSFRTRKKVFSLDLTDSDTDSSQLDQLHTLLLPEMSLFPNPDLFLLDEIGSYDFSSERIRQQFRTIFDSRIAVIAAVSSENLPILDPFIDTVDADLFEFTSAQSDDLHLEVLKRLR